MRAQNLIEAIQGFSSDLCSLGLDRGGLTLEVTEELFLQLVQQARASGAEPPQWPFIQIPVLKWPPVFRQSGEPVAIDSHTSSVELSREMVERGVQIHLHSGPWVVRLEPRARDKFLDMFPKAQPFKTQTSSSW